MLIGVLTFHKALNYGAVLQAYALQETIKKMGYSCEIIDYSSKKHFLENVYAEKGEKSVPHYNRLRKIRFDNFRNDYLCLSKKVYKTEDSFIDVDVLYDVYIVGSDQVWNPAFIRKGISSHIFFLNRDNFQKRIAYAPSIGIESCEGLSKYLKDIAKFDFVCVREKETAQYLSRQLGKKIEVACDPVLLLPRRDWLKLTKKVYKGEAYLLLYLVREDNYSIKIAKKIAKNRKLKLIVINYEKIYKGYKIYNYVNAGPLEFLNCIRHATFVCTSSFHGTAFSIIYNIPFVTVEQMEADYRILNLLETFGLKDRLVKKDNNILDLDKLCQKPNICNSKLNEVRKNSKNMLKNALEEMENK